MLVVVTRLQGRGVAGVVAVGRISRGVTQQLGRQPGFLGGRLLLDRRCAAWTVTGWADRASLEGFRIAHGPVAAGIDEVATDSATTGWVGEQLPTWAEVARRWPSVVPPATGLRGRITASGLPSPTTAESGC